MMGDVFLDSSATPYP